MISGLLFVQFYYYCYSANISSNPRSLAITLPWTLYPHLSTWLTPGFAHFYLAKLPPQPRFMALCLLCSARLPFNALITYMPQLECKLEKEMATHSSVLAWRIPGMGEPGGLLSMGSHRVEHDWSDLAAAECKHREDKDLVSFPGLPPASRRVPGPKKVLKYLWDKSV